MNEINSQNKQIASHLNSGKTITSLEALTLFGCLRLSARIFNLRRDGMTIRSKVFKTESGKHVAQYYIPGEKC